MDITAIKEELLCTAKLELSHYEQLVSLAKEQRDMLINGRNSELSENLSKHDPILIEIIQLNNRIDVLSQQLKAAGYDNSDDFETKRRQIAAKLGDTVTFLRTLVHINAELLVNARNFIDFSVRTIVSLVTEQPSYDTNGSGAGRSLVLDSKV